MNKLPPSPPPKLASLIFLVSDHETLPLACDIAKALEVLDPNLVAWSFLMPVYDATESFVNPVAFCSNWTDPRENPHGDMCKSLAAWAEGFFGDTYFGTRALTEVLENREFGNDQTLVFRDATWRYVEPFLEVFKPHEVLIADLVGAMTKLRSDLYRPFAERHLIFGKPTVESVVKAIVEASK